MVDVGSEWRTFANDKDSKDMSRVGAAENPLFDGDNLETVMSVGTGAGALDEFGNQKYGNGSRQVYFVFFSFNFSNKKLS
jgi:transcription initiation factor TFIIB